MLSHRAKHPTLSLPKATLHCALENIPVSSQRPRWRYGIT